MTSKICVFQSAARRCDRSCSWKDTSILDQKTYTLYLKRLEIEKNLKLKLS